MKIARLNDVGPLAWLGGVLACISDHKIQKLDQLLLWSRSMTSLKVAA